MFKEIENVRQIAGDSKRRWFTDDDIELIVWLGEQDNIKGFQLCYQGDGGRKALTWQESSGFLHAGIDDGDVTFGKHKKSPILVEDGPFDRDYVLERFASGSKGLPETIESLVLAKIREWT